MKNRRNTLRAAKGFRFGRGNKERQANDALAHAWSYAFAHRKDKKNDFRRIWQVKINAAVRPLGVSYSKFMGIAIKKKMLVDRKILADLAENKPETFARVVSKVMA